GQQLQRQIGLIGQAHLPVMRDHLLAIWAEPRLDLCDGLATAVENERHQALRVHSHDLLREHDLDRVCLRELFTVLEELALLAQPPLAECPLFGQLLVAALALSPQPLTYAPFGEKGYADSDYSDGHCSDGGDDAWPVRAGDDRDHGGSIGRCHLAYGPIGSHS